jgi:hypothetical protein
MRMNPYRRAIMRLRGEPVGRPLGFDSLIVCAHHVVRPLSQYCPDHHVLHETRLPVLESFDLGIVQTASDAYRKAAGLVSEIAISEDRLAILTASSEPACADAHAGSTHASRKE